MRGIERHKARQLPYPKRVGGLPEIVEEHGNPKVHGLDALPHRVGCFLGDRLVDGQEYDVAPPLGLEPDECRFRVAGPGGPEKEHDRLPGKFTERHHPTPLVEEVKIRRRRHGPR